MVDKTYKETDETGKVLFENELIGCSNVSWFRTCRFLLRPENPRMGLLMKKGAYGLMTYSARWAAV